MLTTSYKPHPPHCSSSLPQTFKVQKSESQRFVIATRLRHCNSQSTSEIATKSPLILPRMSVEITTDTAMIRIGHFLGGRSLKGRCNIRVYVPACVPVSVCVCVCVCPSPPPPPPDPSNAVGPNSRIPPTPPHDPSPTFPHPCPQAIA